MGGVTAMGAFKDDEWMDSNECVQKTIIGVRTVMGASIDSNVWKDSIGWKDSNGCVQR